MTTEEIAQKVLNLLYEPTLSGSMALEGIYGTHLRVKPSDEQQKEVTRFLLDVTGLCETVSDHGKHVIKLSRFGFMVMKDYGSYSAYLEHQKQVEIQNKLEQQQQAAKETASEKMAAEQRILEEQRAQAQELREVQRDADNKRKEEKDIHRWKVATYLSLTGCLASIVVAVVLWHLDHNQSDSNTKETVHKV